MRRFVRALPVVLLFVIAGCSESTAPVSLRLKRVQWNQQNLHDYAYTGRQSCWCPLSGQDVLVTVQSDTVSSVRLASTGVELPKGGWQTVDQLFDYVERSFGDKSRSVRVEYDRGLGYPTLIEVSCPPNIMDCGVTIVIKNLGGLSFLN